MSAGTSAGSWELPWWCWQVLVLPGVQSWEPEAELDLSPEVSQLSLRLDLLLSSLGFNFSSPLFSHLFLFSVS